MDKRVDRELIAKVIREWDWAGFGLDFVEEANPEFADWLADDIAHALELQHGGQA